MQPTAYTHRLSTEPVHWVGNEPTTLRYETSGRTTMPVVIVRVSTINLYIIIIEEKVWKGVLGLAVWSVPVYASVHGLKFMVSSAVSILP